MLILIICSFMINMISINFYGPPWELFPQNRCYMINLFVMFYDWSVLRWKGIRQQCFTTVICHYWHCIEHVLCRMYQLYMWSCSTWATTSMVLHEDFEPKMLLQTQCCNDMVILTLYWASSVRYVSVSVKHLLLIN